MSNIILYRGADFEKEELESASKYFTCTDRRPSIQSGDFVIGRYSFWPFYADQVKDIEYVGASVINSYKQHRYIADLQNYVSDLGDLTPKTWTSLVDIPEKGPFVLKGETNSRKSNWLEDMFAPDKRAAIDIYTRLCSDSLIGQQTIYIRQYVPLVTYMHGINGIPVTKEFRFFVAYGQVVSGAYYWQNYVDDLPKVPDPSEVPLDFLDKVIKQVGNNSNFYVIDVAETVAGNWIVIELNDGQQSGLSCNNPEVLYKNLYEAIKDR